MKKLYIVIILFISAVAFNACNKDTDIFVADPGQITGPDSTWYSAASITSFKPVNDLRESLLLSPDIDSVSMDNDDSLNSASGLKCVFGAHSCVDAGGSQVGGKITVESYLLKKKGDLLRMGLPTISNGNLLVSGGVFYLNLKNASGSLQLAPQINLALQYADTLSSGKMKLFTPDSTVVEPFNWVLMAESNTNRAYAYNNQYNITTTQLHWINCDYFYGDTSYANKTTVSVKLPANLTNANTIAYIVFNDMRSLMVMNGDIATKLFTTNKVPTGLNATIVTISKDGNFYYLGQQAITTSTSAQPVKVVPARLTLDAIKDYLNTL